MTPDRRTAIAALAALGLPPLSAAAHAQDPFTAQRRALVDVVSASFRDLPGRGLPRTLSPRVAAALRAIPRHEFVPVGERRHAYENRPLAIGYGQTISQPFIVALMTELAGLAQGERALEIGTGSGYQAAILAELGATAHTIEIVPGLGRPAAQRLARLGYERVQTRIGDGYFGWQEAAPFDAILVTAAASHIPPPLTRQLAPGGRMVIPVGPPFVVQQLALVTKDRTGALRTRQLLPVRFVPLVRA